MKLARELASNKTGLPDFIINIALSFITDSILEKAKFNINDLDIVVRAQKSSVPAIFITSKKDSFTTYHHTERL